MATKQVTETRKTRTPGEIFAYPFTELKHEMDHLFDRFLTSRPAFDFTTPSRESFGTMETPLKGYMVPDVDVWETKRQVKVRAELPGMGKEDVSLTLQDGVLSLKGEKKFEKESDEENGRIVECRYGRFERSFTLPVSADWSKISAKFKNGVLTITMPKLPEKEWPVKRIDIS